MTEEITLDDLNKDVASKQIEMNVSAAVEEVAAEPKSGNLDGTIEDGTIEDGQKDIGAGPDYDDNSVNCGNAEGSREDSSAVDGPNEADFGNSLDRAEISSETKENSTDAINKEMMNDKLEKDEEVAEVDDIEEETKQDEENSTKQDKISEDVTKDEIQENTSKVDEIEEEASRMDEIKEGDATKVGGEVKSETVSEENENENVDKLINSKPTEKVESYSDDEIELDEGESSDSDSSSEDSDSSSDSDSDSDSSSEGDDKKVSAVDIDDLADDEDEPSNGPIVSKNEVADESAPKLPEDYKIPDNAPLELIGEITGLVEKSAIIKANISGEFRVLNDSSIFCFEDRTVLGPLFETFGRLQSPMYRVKFDDENEFNKLKDKKGAKVYYVVPDSQFIYTETIKNLKGTDASNCHDEELPEEEQEFSDDERELAAKQSKKRKKKTKNTKDNSVLNEPQPPKQTNNRKRHHGNTNNAENQNSNQNLKYQPYGYPQNNQAQQLNVPPANSVQHQHNNPLIHSLPNLQVHQILQLQQHQQQQHQHQHQHQQQEQQQQQQQGYVPHMQPPQQHAYFPSPQQAYNQPQLQNQFQGHSLVYGSPYNQQQQHNILGHNQHPVYNPNQQPPNPYFPQGTTNSYVPNVPQTNYQQWNQGPQQNQLQQLQQLVVNHLNGQIQQPPASNNPQYPGGNNPLQN